MACKLDAVLKHLPDIPESGEGASDIPNYVHHVGTGEERGEEAGDK
jgi:hypothetical protein